MNAHQRRVYMRAAWRKMANYGAELQREIAESGRRPVVQYGFYRPGRSGPKPPARIILFDGII